MNIIFITQVWPLSEQSNMYSELVEAIQTNGNIVYVVVLNEKRNKANPGLSHENGFTVLRVPCGNIQKTNKYEKVISSILAGPSLLRYVKRYFGREKIDLIVWALSTNLISNSIYRIKKMFSAPLYLLLKEYWPQDPCDLGAMKKDGFVYRFIDRFQRITIHIADYIGTCSVAGIDYIRKNYAKYSKGVLEVCPNCERNKTIDISRRAEIRSRYGIKENDVVFIFGGNLGVSQGIDDMILCISEAADIPGVVFLIMGSGTEYVKVEKYFEKGFDNVKVLPSVPQNEFFELCCVCDVGMIFLYKDYHVPNIPGKFTTYLNAGLPVLAAVDTTTDVGIICKENDCGYHLLNGDIARFRECVQELKIIDNRKTKGQNAKALFLNVYDTKNACEVVLSHFSSPK